MSSAAAVDQCQDGRTIELPEAVPRAALGDTFVTDAGCLVATTAAIVESPEFEQPRQRRFEIRQVASEKQLLVESDFGLGGRFVESRTVVQ